MSKLKFKIGPAARRYLKETSPYATLLLDISSGLTTEDIASFKLAIQADKLAGRRQVCQLKHGADVLSFLDNRELITNTDTEFLENLLLKIGRKDLEKRVRKYHEARTKNASANAKDKPDKVFAQFTQLKSVSDQMRAQMKYLSIETSVKEVVDSSTRSGPEGASHCLSLCETGILPASQENIELRQSFSSSPMSVDSSQGNCTDEEKIGQLSDKVWLYENDAIMSSQ